MVAQQIGAGWRGGGGGCGCRIRDSGWGGSALHDDLCPKHIVGTVADTKLFSRFILQHPVAVVFASLRWRNHIDTQVDALAGCYRTSDGFTFARRPMCCLKYKPIDTFHSRCSPHIFQPPDFFEGCVGREVRLVGNSDVTNKLGCVTDGVVLG